MKIFVAHSSDLEFGEKLYKPLRESNLNSEHQIILPQENGKEHITTELIKSCDVIIAEVSLPSTGQGIELGWADIFNVPIICIQERGSKRSGSLSHISDIFIEYGNSIEMIEKLNQKLLELT